MNPPLEERWSSGPGILASAWRYRWWVLVATIVAAALGYGLSILQPTTYEATARLFLTDPRQVAVFGGQRSVDPERYIPQQTERVTSSPVLERVSDLLSTELSGDELERRLTVEGDVELDLIEITARTRDAESAAELANVAALAYTQVAQESRLAAAREAADELGQAAEELDDQIAELQSGDLDEDEAVADQIDVLIRQRVDIASRAQQQLVEARVFGSGVDFLEDASPPRAPAGPSPARDAALSAVLGMALAVGIAYWRAGRLTKIEGRNQPAEILGAPLLGVLPLYRDSRGDSLDDRLAIDAEAQEAYEFLLSSLEYAADPIGARSVLVTSAEPGQGKTEVALQLSVTALLQGRRTVLVDGDLRVRSLTHLVDADGGPGLVDLAVSAPRQYRNFLQIRSILGGETMLPILPAGSTADEGAASLRQAGVRRGLKVLGEEVDLVMVDSAPLLATADTTTLSSSVDAILLVVRVGTDIRDLESLRERLSFVGCPVLGYVYITGDRSDVGYAFGYGAYRYRHSRTVKSQVVGLPDEVHTPDVVDWLRDGPQQRPGGPPARPPLARREEAPTADEDRAPSPEPDGPAVEPEDRDDVPGDGERQAPPDGTPPDGPDGWTRPAPVSDAGPR